MKPADGPETRELARLISERHDEILAFVRRRAGGGLLRLETVEDLAQGVCAHALAQEQHVEGRDALGAWLFRLAENFLHDRRDYWTALKRSGSNVLRAGLGGTADGELSQVGGLAASVTGPSTFAIRREQIQVAACALDMLLPRDRELVSGIAHGLTVEEQTAGLGLSYDAVVQSRRRALERFRSCFRLALGGPAA